jgi:hypothetical protein
MCIKSGVDALANLPSLGKVVPARGCGHFGNETGPRVIVSPPRETGGGFFVSKRKSDDYAAALASPPERVCILVVDAIIDEIEVEIWCQRTDGVDRVFSTSMDWLHAERPSEHTLAYSVETLLFDIVARCLRYVGEPVDVQAGLLSKGHVWAIITSVCLEMDEIKNENELGRRPIVTKAAHLGLALQASHFSRGIWIACCPGTNHTLELQPKRNLFYCGCCRVGGGIDELAVRCPEKEYSCGFHRTTNLALTYLGRRDSSDILLTFSCRKTLSGLLGIFRRQRFVRGPRSHRLAAQSPG